MSLRRWFRPECVYWLIVAPATIALVFLIGPLHGPDEPAHLYRADGLSNGSVLPAVVPTTAAYGAAGGQVDATLRAWVLARAPGEEISPLSFGVYWSEVTGRGDGVRIAVPYSNTVIYPPVLYLQSAAAIAVARAARLPVKLWLYAGRLANASLAITIIATLMRTMPPLRPLILVFASLPIVFFQSATVSIDGVMLPVVIAFACLLATTFAPEANRRVVTLAFALTTLVLCVGKVAYLPLAILPPLAARAADGRWSRRAVVLAVASIGSTIAWASWAWIIHDKVFTIRQYIPVDPMAQLRFVASHPLQAVTIFGHSVAVNARFLAATSIGSHLGNFNLRLWHPFVFFGFFVLLGAAVRGTALAVPRWFIGFVFATGLAVCAVVVLLLYLQFNPVAQSVVEGIQGRYLLPSLILVITLSPLMSRHRDPAWFERFAVVFAFASVAVVLLATRAYWAA